MKTEASCHLVDFTVLQATSVSLTLGYLQAFSEADERIAGRYEFSSYCGFIDRGIEQSWQMIQRSINDSRSRKHVFGFTNFFWNRHLNLILASRIKSILPEALIVFGGNEVTDQAERLLSEHGCIDLIVNGEGEEVFANVLANYLDDRIDFHTVKGVSFRDAANSTVTTARQPRIDDLDRIPSPFVRGLFSAEALRKSVDIAYEFSRGCPFKCAFCFWGAAVGTKTRRFSSDRIRQDLEFIISHAGPVVRLWLADANFGMTEADVETAHILADLVQKHRKQVYLITSWAKNTTKRVIDAATVLYRNGIITGVTLAAQSLNDEVLEIAQRKNIPFDYYRRLQEQFRHLGIPTYTELIFGMPGESYESFIEGVDRVISAGGSPIIHPLLLLNNTEYEAPQTRERYAIRSKSISYMGPSVTAAEVLVSHNRLSYEDWLRGMGLRLAVPLFYCGILKFVMKQLHETYGLGYAKMLDRLVRYCMEGKVESHPVFRRMFLHHNRAWESDEFLAPQADGIPRTKTQLGDAHYRTLMRIVLRDTQAAGPLISELAALIGRDSGHEGGVEFSRWVEYQKLLIDAMALATSRVGGELQTSLQASCLREYAGHAVARDSGSERWVTVRAEYKSLSLEEFISRILYAGIDTLQMFTKFESASSVTAAS